jgi:hypothetical protein
MLFEIVLGALFRTEVDVYDSWSFLILLETHELVSLGDQVKACIDQTEWDKNMEKLTWNPVVF